MVVARRRITPVTTHTPGRQAGRQEWEEEEEEEEVLECEDETV